jgi:hypothetical protein
MPRDGLRFSPNRPHLQAAMEYGGKWRFPVPGPGFARCRLSSVPDLIPVYCDQAVGPILPQAVAKLPADSWAAMVQPLVAQLPWGHNVLLMERIKDLSTRLWYPAKLKSSLPSIEEIEAELSTSKPPRRLREKLQ